MDDISVEWITSENYDQLERNIILYNIPERNNNKKDSRDRCVRARYVCIIQF